MMHVRWIVWDQETGGEGVNPHLQSWGVSHNARAHRWTLHDRRDTRRFDRGAGRLATEHRRFASAEELVSLLFDGEPQLEPAHVLETLRSMPEAPRRELAAALAPIPHQPDERVERLLSAPGDGLPVIGLPTSADPETWVAAGGDRHALFDLLVGVPAAHPTEVWRLIIDETENPYYGTGFRLGRVIPEDPLAGWVHGWMGLDAASVGVALSCDHRTALHRSRVLDLSAWDLGGMPEIVEMIQEGWEEPTVDDAVTYFSSRLAPLAIAIAEAFLAGGTEEPLKVPPFSLLPPGPEWQPRTWSPTPKATYELIPMFYGVEDGKYMEWMPFDVTVEDMAEDHGRFSAGDWGDIPGMAMVYSGWAAWPDRTVRAVSRDDNYDDEPPVINRVALPGFDGPSPKDPAWRLAFKRALVFASSWLPREWP